MPTKVIMPQLGESVVEGTVSRWLKSVGDSIQEYDPLVEVSTDKVDTEVPSPASGTILEILIPEGETVQAGTLLCLIGDPSEQGTAPDSAATTRRSNGNHIQQQAQPSASHAIDRADKRAASRANSHMTPVVARMVAEHHLDVSQIQGSGRDGRVTKKDVEAYLQGQQAPAPVKEIPAWEQPVDGDLFKPTDTLADFAKPAAPPASPARPATASPSSGSPPAPRAIPTEAIPEGAAGELVQLSGMRRAIAQHMVQSKLHTAPHVTTVFEADLNRVLAHMAQHKAHYAKQGVNLTLTAYFVQAMVAASQANPTLNSQWTDEGIYLHHAVHVGMAVAVDEGLIVPVIHHADELNLLGLARKINDLASRARNKQLKPDEVQGGTITITNHGVSGSLFATPIISQPQSAIFGVGMMEKRVRVIDDAIAIRPCVYISLTFDHRVADGASADGWMMSVKQTLENWPAD